MFRTLSRVGVSAAAAAAAVVTVLAPTAPASGADAYYPDVPSASMITPSPATCAVSVAPYVAAVPQGGDDTAGFTAAMAAAVQNHPNCYAAGPAGQPQAVVSVPPGVYRVDDLYFPSNLRMEVNAGATVEPIQNRADTSQSSFPMIVWDTQGKNQPAIRNVSMVGVGRSTDLRKTAAKIAGGMPMSGFDLSTSFTMNMDPAQTNSSNYVVGLSLMNVQNFLIQNVFSVQNNTGYSAAPVNGINPWPTSSRPVIQLHARRDSPITGPFIQPMHGTITNQVNIGGPRGYGPNQINAATDLTVSDIYSDGGTALRIETDGSTNGRGVPNKGATVDQLHATDIVGANCNRAVSLSPHGQRNGYVTVQNVWAFSCNQGVIASRDNDVYPQYQGLFRGAAVDGLHVVAGTTAQLDSTTSIWVVGQSLKAVQIDPNLVWSPRITVVGQLGAFRRS